MLPGSLNFELAKYTVDLIMKRLGRLTIVDKDRAKRLPDITAMFPDMIRLEAVPPSKADDKDFRRQLRYTRDQSDYRRAE